MGVDISFYIQRKNNVGKWENVFLYNEVDNIVSIDTVGYDTYDYLKENWNMSVDEEEIKDLAFITEWITEEEREDELSLPYYVATYSKIKYLAKAYNNIYNVDEENKEAQKFWEDLNNEIRAYLTFAGYNFIDSDNIRVIAFVSY